MALTPQYDDQTTYMSMFQCPQCNGFHFNVDVAGLLRCTTRVKEDVYGCGWTGSVPVSTDSGDAPDEITNLKLAAIKKAVEPWTNSLISTPDGPLLCCHKVMVQYDKTEQRAIRAEKAVQQLREALEKINGFGRSPRGTPDMTFDELAGYVNETCEEALSTLKPDNK